MTDSVEDSTMNAYLKWLGEGFNSSLEYFLMKGLMWVCKPFGPSRGSALILNLSNLRERLKTYRYSWALLLSTLTKFTTASFREYWMLFLFGQAN